MSIASKKRKMSVSVKTKTTAGSLQGLREARAALQENLHSYIGRNCQLNQDFQQICTVLKKHELLLRQKLKRGGLNKRETNNIFRTTHKPCASLNSTHDDHSPSPTKPRRKFSKKQKIATYKIPFPRPSQNSNKENPFQKPTITDLENELTKELFTTHNFQNKAQKPYPQIFTKSSPKALHPPLNFHSSLSVDSNLVSDYELAQNPAKKAHKKGEKNLLPNMGIDLNYVRKIGDDRLTNRIEENDY